MKHNQEGYIDKSSLRVGFPKDTYEALYVILHNDLFSAQKQEFENDYGKLYNIKIKCIIDDCLKTYKIDGFNHIEPIDLEQLSPSSYTILNVQQELITELNKVLGSGEEILIDELEEFLDMALAINNDDDNLDHVRENIESAIIDHIYHHKVYDFAHILEQVFLCFQQHSRGEKGLELFATQESAHRTIAKIAQSTSHLENGFNKQEINNKIHLLSAFYKHYKDQNSQYDGTTALTQQPHSGEYLDPRQSPREILEKLYTLLEMAVSEEDYEYAAELRDEIQIIEDKINTHKDQ